MVGMSKSQFYFCFAIGLFAAAVALSNDTSVFAALWGAGTGFVGLAYAMRQRR